MSCRWTRTPYADWSCHLFTAGRKQYIILSNTASLYSCVMDAKGITDVMDAKGITDQPKFIERALETIEELMKANGQASVYEQFNASTTETVNFAKALNRKVTGSMNALVMAASYSLQLGEVAPHELGVGLNDLLLSAIASKEDRGYAKPNEAFKRLALGSLPPAERDNK